MKGVALFATLIGVYQWLGQEASLYDIMVILFATALIVSIELEQKHDIKKNNAPGDNPTQKGFFWRITHPLSKMIVRGYSRPSLQPLYLFSH